MNRIAHRVALSRTLLWSLLVGAWLGACVGASTRGAEPEAPADNPYSPSERLSRAELDEFIVSMQSKPKSLQKRPGFGAAILEAAERIVAERRDDELAMRAQLARLDTLQFMATEGDTAADENLAKLAEQLADDPQESVREAASFYRLERQALDADALMPEELPKLLEALKRYCSTHPLGERHLRIASATVRIINRLPDVAAAQKAYLEFGGWFAKSEDPELARYGKKIEKGPKAVKPDSKEEAEEPPPLEPAPE